MNKQETLLWESGMTDAPLPPLADAQDVDIATDPFLELYHKLGPIYRLARQDEKPLVVLAGAEANAFTSRYGDEFFVSAELWKEFNNAMGGMAGGMTTMRDGEANRKRRAKTVRDYSRTKVLDQLPRMIEITNQHAQWQPGQIIDVLPAMQRIVAEQLGQLLINYSVGEYLEDFVIYLSTSIISFAGHRLEPGNEVYVATTVPHFLPELFPHPETFDIDRYREPRNEHRQRGAYAPFGLGEHTCLGAGMAEIQLMVITATLLHTYRFELDPPGYQLTQGQQLTIEDDADGRSGKQFCLKVAARRA